jgi:hypothetical protein
MRPTQEMTRVQNGITPTQAGGVVRQGFAGQTELEVRQATAMAIAEREKATIQALYGLAQMRPRDWDVVRFQLLKDCGRFGFADAAIWEIPRGGKQIDGLSIRFAEAAGRAMGKLDERVHVIEDAPGYRRIEVAVIDCESLYRVSREIQVEKTVERKKLAKGQDAVSQRVNSYGEPVYRVEATEEELVMMANALISKVRRVLLLSLLPADIKEECEARCHETINKGINEDPEAMRKRISDSFAKVGIFPEDLAEYLGHPLAKVTPKETAELRGLIQAITQGQSTWREELRLKLEKEGREPSAPGAVKAPPPRAAAAPKKTVQGTVVTAAPVEPTEQEAPPHDPATGELFDLEAQAQAEEATEALRAADEQARQAAEAAQPRGPEPKTPEYTAWLLEQIQAAVDAKDPDALKRTSSLQQNCPTIEDQQMVARAYLAARKKVRS